MLNLNFRLQVLGLYSSFSQCRSLILPVQRNGSGNATTSSSAALEAGCLLTGNGAKGGFSNIAAKNIAIKTSKENCAGQCNKMM
jgi:hypothetical protein